jgi:hypothetical protein
MNPSCRTVFAGQAVVFWGRRWFRQQAFMVRERERNADQKTSFKTDGLFGLYLKVLVRVDHERWRDEP